MTEAPVNDTIIDVVRTLQKHIDAPTSFLVGGAYWLNSALLGQFYRCRHIPSGMPNVWYIMASIPGRCRRSSVMSAYVTIYRKVMTKYLEKTGITDIFNQEIRETFEALPEKEQQKKKNKPKYVSHGMYIENTRLEEGTPEGIMDAIQYAHENLKLNTFHFTNPEFGGTLSQMGKTGTPYGISRIMSMLWSGEPGKVNLSMRGDKESVRYVPEGLYVTLLAGMQEPWTYVDMRSIKQGLMRRALVDYALSHDKYLPLIAHNREEYQKTLDTIADVLFERMSRIVEYTFDSSYDYLPAGFDIDSWEVVNAYDELWNRKVDQHATLVNIMLQSKGVHLSKFSIVRALARGELEDDGTIVASMKDVEDSMNFIESITKNYDIWVSNIGLEEKRMSKLEGYDRMVEILDTTTDFRTKHELNVKMGNAVLADDVKKWYQTGRARGEMRSVRIIKPQAKKAPVYIFLEKHREDFLEWVKTNGWKVGTWVTDMDEGSSVVVE